jgi:D-alanyl-D-alanine dipeptidase
MRPRASVGVAALALGLAVAACCAKAQRSPDGVTSVPAASPLPADAEQLILGIAEDWNASSVVLRRFEREGAGEWRAVGEPWDGTIGRAGLAWGRGLHGDGAPRGQRGPVKVEGDGRAPAGLFAIGRAFGYDAEPPGPSRMSYAQLTESWRCVDDPGSASYNRVLDAAGLAPDWQSAEVMRRDDDLYRWVVEIDHNHLVAPDAPADGAPSAGQGSCIFFHVWGAPDRPTAGCTAMSVNKIEDLLTSLDPARKPVYALLPAPADRALKREWALPSP